MLFQEISTRSNAIIHSTSQLVSISVVGVYLQESVITNEVLFQSSVLDTTGGLLIPPVSLWVVSDLDGTHYVNIFTAITSEIKVSEEDIETGIHKYFTMLLV